MNKSIRFRNRDTIPSYIKGAVFDLTKLTEYPLRMLSIRKNDNNQKTLYFEHVQISDLFPIDRSKTQKYLVIGETNRSNLSKEYIVKTAEEMHEAIQLYIAKSLSKSCDPLDYYIVKFTKTYDLRPYKRLIGKKIPILLP